MMGVDPRRFGSYATKGYLKEKESVNGLNAITNFVISSAILSDFENSDVDFDEIISFYKRSPQFSRIKDP